MARLLDFPVRIQRKTVAVSERGFGTILIFDPKRDIDYQLITSDDINNTELFPLRSDVYNLASVKFIV